VGGGGGVTLGPPGFGSVERVGPGGELVDGDRCNFL